MRSPHDQQFQYKQNSLFAQNSIKTGRSKSHQHKPNLPVTYSNPNRKTIICANDNIGFNVQEHLNRLQNIYEQKILKENIMKAVIGTFMRRKLLEEGQFQVQKAFEEAQIQSKAYVDKLETWLQDSIVSSSALSKFQQYKQKKFEQRTAKVQSIMKLIQKIATKIQDKKLAQIKQSYRTTLQQKIVKIPQNKQYSKALYKLKFIKERVSSNKHKIMSETIL